MISFEDCNTENFREVARRLESEGFFAKEAPLEMELKVLHFHCLRCSYQGLDYRLYRRPEGYGSGTPDHLAFLVCPRCKTWQQTLPKTR